MTIRLVYTSRSITIGVGHIGDEGSLAPLIRLHDHPDPEVRYGVTFGLLRRPDAADLTDSGDDLVGATRITALGDAATKLSFTAALDAQGRLTTASVVMPAFTKFRAFTYKIIYNQYATVPVPTAPTGATKAIPEVYTWLGGDGLR